MRVVAPGRLPAGPAGALPRSAWTPATKGCGSMNSQVSVALTISQGESGFEPAAAIASPDFG